MALQKTFFLNIDIANFFACLDFFAYICFCECSKYEYISYSMNFLLNIYFIFSWWVFPLSNFLEIKAYLENCSLFRENSPSEHSLNILRKFKQITNDLSFTCNNTVPELTGNKNLSQLHIRGNLTCFILIEKFYYSAGYNTCCCHSGEKSKLITDINCYPICLSCKCKNKKQRQSLKQQN